MHKAGSLVVQSFLFKRERWTLAAARKWLREHGHAASSPDVTKHFYRFRQREPDHFVKNSYRMIQIASGIEATAGQLKSAWRD